jgi:ANTAR domain/GAF domain
MNADLLSDTFVELADTLVAGFDIIDFLQMLTERSALLLEVTAAGVLLADPRGALRVAAASSEEVRLLELFQLQADEGPCLDCYRSAQPTGAEDLAVADQKWPRFAAAGLAAGFRSVQALPMRLRDEAVGALNLFSVNPGGLSQQSLRMGQALADVATIGLLHERSVRRGDTLNEQLQAALNSRVIIEQAKGRLAERLGLGMDEAFAILRAQARNRNERITDVARHVIDGDPRYLSPNPAARQQRPAPGA